LELEMVQVPLILEPGQVLVKVIRSGVCASQLNEIRGKKGFDHFLPHALGHEGVGEVLDFGAGVTKFSIGDKVVMHWRKSTGISSPGSSYAAKDGSRVNFGPITTLSELSIVSEDRLSLLPTRFPVDLAPLLGCALLTGFGAVTREARVQPGESCLILGLGGVGISILKSLKLVSASPIVVVDISLDKIQLAERLGADEAVLVDADESQLRKLLEGKGISSPDVIFECTGQRSLIEQTLEIVSPTGRVLLIGVPDAGNPAKIATLPLHLGVSMTGSHGGSSEPHEDIPKLAKLVDSGLLRLEDYPTETFRFERINDAIDKLGAGVLGRVIVNMLQ